MIASLGVDTDRTKMVGLALSNAFIALSGALVAQNHGFADIGMGIGILVTGAAAVLIGEAIFGDRTVAWWVLAAICGTVIYRLLVALALRVGFEPVDLRLVTAVLLLLALTIPRWRRAGAQMTPLLSLAGVTKRFHAGTPSEAVGACATSISRWRRATSSPSSDRTGPANRPCSRRSPEWSSPTPARLASRDATSRGSPVYRRADTIGRIAQDPGDSTCAAMTIEENLAMAERRGMRRGLRRAVTQAARARFVAALAPIGLGLEIAAWRSGVGGAYPAASARRSPC